MCCHGLACMGVAPSPQLSQALLDHTQGWLLSAGGTPTGGTPTGGTPSLGSAGPEGAASAGGQQQAEGAASSRDPPGPGRWCAVPRWPGCWGRCKL